MSARGRGSAPSAPAVGEQVVPSSDARDPASRFASCLLAHRAAVVIAVLLLAAVSAAGVLRLELDTDYRAFFGADNPDLVAYERFQDIYARHDQILLVLVPESGRVFERDVLVALETLTSEAWQLPYASRVDSLTNYQHTYAEEDEIVVRALARDAAALSDRAIAEVEETALAEPELVGRLVSPAADVAGISVRVVLPADDSLAVVRLARTARELAAEFERAHPGVDVRLTGNVMLNAAFPEATFADLRTIVPSMYLVIAVTLALLLRSLIQAGLVLLVVGLAASTALGLAGWLGIVLTPPSAAAPTIVMTITVANCIHLLTGAAEQRASGLTGALTRSLVLNLRPILFTNITTAVGFLSLNLSDAPPLRALGNITAMGVAAAFVFSITLVPVLLREPAGMARAPRGSVALGALARFVQRFATPVLVAGLLATIAAAVTVPRLELNDEFVAYFDEDLEFRRDTDFVMERLSGIYRIHFDLGAGETDGILDPGYLERLDSFTGWLREQPEVVHVSSVADVMKRLSRNLHGDDRGWHRLPESRELAAQYLLLYEMSVPFGLDLNDRITVDNSATRITATLVNIDNDGLRALAKRAEDWLMEHATPSMRGPPVGAPMMFAAIAERNIQAMLRGTALALVVIAALLMVVLRSSRAGLLSLVPNFVPPVVAFGLWALLVGEMGLALSVVAAMALGIIVDDTVHFLTGYLRGRRELGLSVEAAVEHTMRRVGPALVHTSIVLVAGFLMLSTSDFQVNQGLGQLTALVIAIALAADLTILPALLVRLGEWLR